MNAGRRKTPPRQRLKRVIGYAFMAAIWGALAGLVAFFALVYAIYADLNASTRSRLTEGTCAEFLGHAIYDYFRSPIGSMPDPLLVYVPRPGVTRHRAPEFDINATITADGMRQQPPFPAKEGESILMVGDSFTLGQGVRDEETYSYLLQERFHLPTVNTGVISYGTARELTRLHRAGLLTRASMLVIQFCSNDARENSDFVRDPAAPFARSDPSRTWVFTRSFLRQFEAPTYTAVLSATVRYLRYRIATDGFWRAAKDIRRSRHLAFGARVPVRDNPGGDALAADFLHVLDQFPELAGKPILALELNDRGGTTGFTEALRAKAAGRPNLRVVSFRFEPADFFRFDGHLTPAGNEKVAATLAVEIRAQREAAGAAK